MTEVGFSVAVHDVVTAARQIVRYVTSCSCADGAFSEVCEIVLKARCVGLT